MELPIVAVDEATDAESFGTLSEADDEGRDGGAVDGSEATEG